MDFFDKGLHHLGKTHKSGSNSTFVINIGSMDGVMFDEMYGYSSMYDFKGLYVEPIPYLFEKLKKNIQKNMNGDAVDKDGNLFENSAISDYDGEIDMIMIDRNAIDNGDVNRCFYGMSAVYPPKNGLGSEGDKDTVEKYGQMIKVPCITFETLMTKHNINQFDVVKMDTEGHDYKIFKQIDLKKYKPKVIRLEWINLSEDEKKDLFNILNNNDYIYEIMNQDIDSFT